MPKPWDTQRIHNALRDIIQSRHILKGETPCFSITRIADNEIHVSAPSCQKQVIEDGLATYFKKHGEHPLKAYSYHVQENATLNPLPPKHSCYSAIRYGYPGWD